MIDKAFPGRGKVAILRTRPETVLDDYARLMHLAGYQASLPMDRETFLKINTSWQTWYPACSSAPWQVEGVIRTLLDDGYDRRSLVSAQNRTVVVDAYVAEKNNGHKAVLDKYGIRNVHLYEPQVEWMRYEPQTEMLVLDKIFPEGILIPKLFIDRNIVQFPTVKTHVFTTITGAMRTRLAGFLMRSVTGPTRSFTRPLSISWPSNTRFTPVCSRSWTARSPVTGPARGNALAQERRHPGFGRPGRHRCHLRTDSGLRPDGAPVHSPGARARPGVGDPRDIEILGDVEIADERWGFIQEESLQSRGQAMIYHGPLKPFESFLLRTPLVPWAFAASRLYHDVYWYRQSAHLA